MPTVIDSLLVRLGFSVDPKGLEGFHNKVEQARSHMLAFGAAAVGALYGAREFFKGTAENLGGIQEFAEQMGLNVLSVAALGKVARENGGSMEGMQEGLRHMTVMAGQAAQGIGRGAMIFKRFGLAVKDSHGNVKPTEELLGDVADKMARLPSLGQKLALGSRLGFDAATVKLLSKGREEFNRLRDVALKANPFKRSDYETALLASRAFTKAQMNAEQLRNRLAVGLMPQVVKVLDGMGAWMKNEGNIKKLQQIIQHLADIAALVAKHFTFVTVALIGTKLAMQGIDKLLRGGLLGLFLLLADDLWTFYRGGTSVTGWMLTKFPEAVGVMLGALDLLGAAFIGISAGSGPVGVFAFALGGIAIAAMSIRDAWQPLVDWFKQSLDELEDRIILLTKIITPAIWLVSKVTGKTDAWYGKEKGPAYSPERTGYTEEDFKRRMAEFNARDMLGSPAGLGVLDAGRAAMLPPGAGVRADNRVSTTVNGGIHMTFGGTPRPEDAKKLTDAVMLEISRRSAAMGKDTSRTKTMNGQPATAL